MYIAGLSLDLAAAELVGPEGTAPNTVAPLEFVAFKIDVLVLRKESRKKKHFFLISF